MILLRKSTKPVDQKAQDDLTLAIEADKEEICAAFYKVSNIPIT